MSHQERAFISRDLFHSFEYFIADATEGDGKGCTSEFIYFQIREIYKTRSMIEEDEFRERSRWAFKCSHSVILSL